MTEREKKIIDFETEAQRTHSPPQPNKGGTDSGAESEVEQTPGDDADINDEVERAVRNQIKEDEQKLLSIELPTALAEREIKLYLAAIATGLLSVVISITLMSVQFLLLLPLAAFFIYLALSARMDFRDGKIVEQSLLCYNVQRAARMSSDRYISFCTSDEVPTYYRFRIKDKKATFFPGCPYLVYYHVRNPEYLLAYYQL